MCKSLQWSWNTIKMKYVQRYVQKIQRNYMKWPIQWMNVSPVFPTNMVQTFLFLSFSFLFLIMHYSRSILHSKTPHVVTVLWLDSNDVVTILSPTRNLVEGYKTVYLCHRPPWFLHSDCMYRYLVSSHVVTVQLPTRYLVDRFLHRAHGSGYLITCVSDAVTVL